MQKFVELRVEEAKAVIGGAKVAAHVFAGASLAPVVTTSISANRR
jgi:hypothetical protein